MYADNDRLYELKPEKIIIPLAAPTVVITGKWNFQKYFWESF